MELLPCPFCNRLHAPSVHGDERGFFVWCDTNYGGCGARGAVASTNKGAIIVWNHRAPATTANDGVVTVLHHTGPLPSPSPDIIPPLANAPADPALLASVAEWRALAETQDAIIQRGATLTDPALRALDRELRIRNLIAEREFNTAAANREIAQFGEWRWDHDAADRACADAIAALLAPDGAASEGVPG